MIKNDKNPYTILFGKSPILSISRASQMTDIVESFSCTPPTQQIYMITGVRGCGKTVFMTELSKELGSDKDWIVVDLNSSGDLIHDLAADLASRDSLARLFQKGKINLTVFGLGLEVEGTVPITNIQLAVGEMLENIKKHKKRVLVCIDEVNNSEAMRFFASAFQIYVRKDLPIFLLMTGLYENVNNLQNESNLTFLYRAPKVHLKPLNIGTISESYAKTFDKDQETALEMAKLTMGYSFAFQVLGYFTWKHGGDYKAALSDYRQYLEDYVYEKIWMGLSGVDKKFLNAVAGSKTGKAADIKKRLAIENNQYTPYRDRMIKRGLLNGEEHGVLRFTLPLFDEYVIRNSQE